MTIELSVSSFGFVDFLVDTFGSDMCACNYTAFHLLHALRLSSILVILLCLEMLWGGLCDTNITSSLFHCYLHGSFFFILLFKTFRVSVLEMSL
jgi:hypothetical protein